MKKRVTIYWLIPARPERDLFGDLIRILAKEFDAPPFDPHLTLGSAHDPEAPGRLLRKLQAAPIRLRVRGLARSQKFTKALFVRLAPAGCLTRLAGELGAKPQSLADPHVSLIYKNLPASTKRGLISVISLPFREVTFDQIKAVSCVAPTETRRDVESWRVLATKRLSG
jgi:hypothetical protein